MKALLIAILTVFNLALFSQDLDSIAKMEYSFENKNLYTSSNPGLAHELFIEKHFNQDTTYLMRDYLIVEGHYTAYGNKTFTKIAFHLNGADSYDSIHIFRSNSSNIEVLFVNSEIYTGRVSCNYSVLLPRCERGAYKFKYFVNNDEGITTLFNNLSSL